MLGFFSNWEVCFSMLLFWHECLACVDELVRLQSRPLTKCFSTQLTHEVLHTYRTLRQAVTWCTAVSFAMSGHFGWKCTYCSQMYSDVYAAFQYTHTLTCVSLEVFQHVDLLGKLAVALLTLILFDALMKLHVVAQSVFRFHACKRKVNTVVIQTPTSVRSHITHKMDAMTCVTQQQRPDLSRTLHTKSPGCHRGPWGAPSACPSSRMICCTYHSCGFSPLDDTTHIHKQTQMPCEKKKGFCVWCFLLPLCAMYFSLRCCFP